MVGEAAKEDAAIRSRRKHSRQMPGCYESLETQITTRRFFLLAAEAAMRFSGDCCRRHERNGNVCNTAIQEKVNSAGSL
jgi:hypothetical protein